jgi:hypothetical protein
VVPLLEHNIDQHNYVVFVGGGGVEMGVAMKEFVVDIFDLLMKQDDHQIFEMIVVAVHVLQINMNVAYLGVLRIDQNEHFGLHLMVNGLLFVDILD